MLHVVLLILKILGIILLSVLILLLLVLWAVLYVAVTYRVKVEKKDMLRAEAVGGWLFHILTVRYLYDGGKEQKQELKLRLFGIPVMDLFKQKEGKKSRRRKKKKKEPKQEPESATTSGTADETPEYTVPELPEGPDGEWQGREAEETSDVSRETYLPERVPAQEEEKERVSFAKRLADRIRGFFSKVVYAFRRICDKIKNIKKSIEGLFRRKDELLDFWNLEEHRRARGALWKEILYLWKKLRPKKLEGQIRIGFDDPSVTGMCVGALSALYPWYPGQFRVIADFEQEILEGDVLIKGRVRLYTAALILWRVWFNKDIRHMYEHWQQL